MHKLKRKYFLGISCFMLIMTLTACGNADFIGNSYKIGNSITIEFQTLNTAQAQEIDLKSGDTVRFDVTREVGQIDIAFGLKDASPDYEGKSVETNSFKNGNVLHIIPGQGYQYYEKPKYQVLTNFSPFKGDSEKHPWMGWDRYHIAETMLKDATDDFDISDFFEILKEVSQEVCPTVVSMVFDVTEMKVYWCENRQWDHIQEKFFE